MIDKIQRASDFPLLTKKKVDEDYRPVVSY